MKEFEFSSKGAGMIHAYCWEPNGKPIGVVQLIHGIAEHVLRYDDFARYLNAAGFVVVAEDHMGHGKSHGGSAPLYFDGGWYAAVDDSEALLSKTQEVYPTLPYFLFGHSMGSFMTRTLLFRYPEAKLRGSVICGTGWKSAAVLRLGRALCAGEKRRVTDTASSKLLTKLMFGAYNRKFHENRTPNDWICSNCEVVDRYTADPLCGGDATVGLARAMLEGITAIQKPSNLEKMPKELPIFFIAGKDDPVGDMGKGVEKTYRRFREVGMRNVQIKLYEGRHEILNEAQHAEVYADVLEFFKTMA